MREDVIDAQAFCQDIRRLQSYGFWEAAEGAPGLWEHQQAAIATVVAYLNGDKTIPERAEQIEAALLKLPTGTGKSGIVAVLARCLPNVRRVLVLTPRTALTKQLIADIRHRFWKHMGYEVDGTALFTGDAQTMGAELDDVYVEQLLPSSARQIVHNLCEDDVDRAILVGTHHALGAIRKAAFDPDVPDSDDCQRILAEISKNFDLVVVDEGHYEPAVSWSRGVRDFNLPTLLLSATPYRNDYKSFRVRGRYLFNFPHAQAIERNIIRPAEVILPDVEPEGDRQAAVAQFVEILHQELPNRLAAARNWFRDATKPKVMVRGDDLDTLYMLQSEVNRVFETRSVVIHDRAQKIPQNQDRFTSVASAQHNRSDATFWIHQYKLMEGIDDPTFVAVGIFDLMGNARQLVQQIGRATRHSKGDARFRQTGWVLGSPANASRIHTAWERYKGYEDYAARNTEHIVSNEVTLPDRLLEYMAEYQYISGEFRGRFEFEKPLAAADIQLPQTAAVLKTIEPLSNIQAFGSVIEEAIMDKDRFKITPVDGMPDNVLGFSYYAWRNSPYLIDRFFSEWKLGIFVAVQQGEFVFMHDTEGLVVDMAGLKLKRAGRSLMEKAFPEDGEDNPSRLSRMSFSSLDMSQHAIRGMAMRTRSFADVFTDLLDPSLVPSTAAGFVGGSARYVGFGRSRLRDGSERFVPIADYVGWTAEVAAELGDNGRARSSVFDRYAAIIEDVTTDDAQPVSILLDPSLDEMRDDDAGGAAFVLHEDVNYFDLCSDVDDVNGNFTIEIDDQELQCSVEFVEETGNYRIESDDLNARFPVQERDDRRQGQTLVQRLNQRKSFRILTSREGVIYSEGNFYEPRVRWRLEDGSTPILDYVFASPSLDKVDSEKGENYFSTNRANWHRKSIFGVISATCEGRLATDGIPGDDLTAAIEALPIWLCDDDGQEVADFIGLDPDKKKIVLLHAKVGSQGPGGRGFNVGGLQIVGRQALASVGFISLGRPSPVWTADRWRDDVQANAVPLAGRNRMFRHSAGLDAAGVNDLLISACRNPSFEKEIWIVGAKMTRRQVLEDGLAQAQQQNRLRQFLMHWDAMQTACARANARLKFFCSD
ncbi:DEAD/DEAH box helicase [Actibacterium pelagium]|uniref:DEAD/DEAH box helicase n=1 Tax=Actibacterium pelagium TaxID=2029103 RepID=UPI00166A0ED2|nr:DEAD/DEAH box helicase family protein [Actibacterium pelagium]